MSLDRVVDLQITRNSTAPSRQGFGTPLVMAYHTVTPNLVDEYGSKEEVEDAGFSLISPVYQIASRVFAQSPRPSKILVGRRSLPYTQTVTISPLRITPGYTYIFDLVSPDGSMISVNYTVLAAATVATICTALAALLDLATDVTATAGATAVTLACTAGKLFDLQRLPPRNVMEIQDTTVDPGITTDLAAVAGEDPNSWYGLVFDHTSKASALAAAAWVESLRKLALFTSSDTEITKGTSGNLALALQALNYARSGSVFSGRRLLAYTAPGWMGLLLPKDPGYATWAFKPIVGVEADTFKTAEITALTVANCNYYAVLAGESNTHLGVTASGEFIDITHGIDALYARIQEDIVRPLQTSDKVPFTDSGVDRIRSALRGALVHFKKPRTPGGPTFLDPTVEPTITAPKVADISDADRATRYVPDMTFEDRMSGAIHGAKIRGVLSV